MSRRRLSSCRMSITSTLFQRFAVHFYSGRGCVDGNLARHVFCAKIGVTECSNYEFVVFPWLKWIHVTYWDFHFTCDVSSSRVSVYFGHSTYQLFEGASSRAVLVICLLYQCAYWELRRRRVHCEVTLSLMSSDACCCLNHCYLQSKQCTCDTWNCTYCCWPACLSNSLMLHCGREVFVNY